LAALAPVVSQVAQQGDPVAQQLLRQAGEHLSESLRAVVNGLKVWCGRRSSRLCAPSRRAPSRSNRDTTRPLVPHCWHSKGEHSG
jgi:hypothetical protein